MGSDYGKITLGSTVLIYKCGERKKYETLSGKESYTKMVSYALELKTKHFEKN